MRKIRAASVQFESAAGEKKANLAKMERFLQHAAAQGVELIVFPECCITGYWFLRNLSRDRKGDRLPCCCGRRTVRAPLNGYG